MIRKLLVPGVAQAVRLALAPARGAFVRALGAPRAAQDGALRRILEGLVATDYGRAHRLRSGDGYAAFRDKLPVVGYDDLAPWVERQMREEGSILVPGPVRVYE